MVELLVAMAIMGLLIIMAFPTIRAIQANNNNTKYKEYGTSAISAAKIYADSYAEDLFASEQSNEFIVVNFDELVRKDLIKDINISEATCIIESSVTIVKYKDDYSYCLHLVCKHKNSSAGDKPLYEEENRRGNCSKFTPRKVNYIYDITKSKDAVDGDENYTVLNPSRLGFNFNANHDVFLKWNTKRDGTGKTYNPGEKLDKIEGDVNLYAITRKWEYYLHLNKGIADSGTISENPKKCSYGSDCPIPDNKYSKVGYTFDGWSDGTNKYSNKENVKTRIGNNIPGDGHRVYLTATFKIKSCTVTYSPNGGKFNNHANDVVQTVNWGSYFGDEKDGMRNALGGHYNATRSGYQLNEVNAWTNGIKSFDQRKRYLAQDVCDLSVKSNSTTLNANWIVIPTYTCAAGKYLKKNNTTCTTCPANYYCPGGKFYKSTSADQGINACPSSHKISSAGSTKIQNCYKTLKATFKYQNHANYWNVPDRASKEEKECSVNYPAASCTVTGRTLSSLDEKLVSGCGSKYTKLLVPKGWNTDANAKTGKYSLSISSNTTFYSIIVGNPDYINKKHAFQVYAHSCNPKHSSNVYNRTGPAQGSYFNPKSYIVEEAYFIWNGDWYVNSNYLDEPDKDKDTKGWFYLVGKGTKCKNGSCHKNSYIKAFQLKF